MMISNGLLGDVYTVGGSKPAALLAILSRVIPTEDHHNVNAQHHQQLTVVVLEKDNSHLVTKTPGVTHLEPVYTRRPQNTKL